MEMFSSPFEEPYFGFTRRAFFVFYFVFMFTTSSKNFSNNKLIEQPHMYYFWGQASAALKCFTFSGGTFNI